VGVTGIGMSLDPTGWNGVTNQLPVVSCHWTLPIGIFYALDGRSSDVQ